LLKVVYITDICGISYATHNYTWAEMTVYVYVCTYIQGGPAKVKQLAFLFVKFE